MSKRYDAILKHLPEEYPHDWALLAGVTRSEPVTVIDADVSTVTAAADKVLRVGGSTPWLLHLEFQASYDTTLSKRLLKMGLQYESGFASQLLRGVRSMKESVTYQAIIEEGRADEARRILLAQGTKLFGKPSAKVRRTIGAISDSELLEGLATRLLDVESWSELLAEV